MMNSLEKIKISLVFLTLTVSSPVSAGMFSEIFEPSHISSHKDSCENAIRNELFYKTEYEAGFSSLDVFNASFLSSRESDGKLYYHYQIIAEGIWQPGKERDVFSSSRGRYSEDNPLDEFIISQHKEFSGKAYCAFYSKESKTPYTLYVEGAR